MAEENVSKTYAKRQKELKGGAEKGYSKRQSEDEDSQTQLFGRFRLVTRRTLPAARAMGMAQQTMRGVERPLLLIGGDV